MFARIGRHELPNNRLQGMRGLHAFGLRKGLRAGPAPLTLGSLGLVEQPSLGRNSM
jgi:hypothetical protein